MGISRIDPTSQTSSGFVAYFDILGYKRVLTANSAEESLRIFNDAMLRSVEDTKRNFGKIIIKPNVLVVSDSILLLLPDKLESKAGEPAPIMFLFFCAALMTSLLQRGLPARGAVSSGEFCIGSKRNQIVYVGEPIVKAIELANSLEVSACAIAPTTESKLADQHCRQCLELYETPMKGQPKCELYLLKYHFKPASITRERLIRCFTKHKKPLDSNSLPKFNNTVHFLRKCQQLTD